MKVGLITYHSAYNFGSVLQAYATQEIIKKLTGNCTIINYRISEQRRVYSIFQPVNGIKDIKGIVKNILVLPFYFAKKRRKEGYERLIRDIFHLTEECGNYDEVQKIWNQFDLIVSGSDQIWNKHSNELKNVSWEYMKPYLLAGFKGKKISYASSIPNMSEDETRYISEYLIEFSSIAARELSGANILNSIDKIRAEVVLDPTFLLSKEEWISKFNLEKRNIEKKNQYVLYYALNARENIAETRDVVLHWAKKRGLRVKIIAPLSLQYSSPGVEILRDTDPVEFLNLIYNAHTVVTDSYHGTILSINFEKNIYSINGVNQSDIRKTEVLDKLGLQDRNIVNLQSLLEDQCTEIDYSAVSLKLEYLMEESLSYLKKALEV